MVTEHTCGKVKSAQISSARPIRMLVTVTIIIVIVNEYVFHAVLNATNESEYEEVAMKNQRKKQNKKQRPSDLIKLPLLCILLTTYFV